MLVGSHQADGPRAPAEWKRTGWPPHDRMGSAARSRPEHARTADEGSPASFLNRLYENLTECQRRGPEFITPLKHAFAETSYLSRAFSVSLEEIDEQIRIPEHPTHSQPPRTRRTYLSAPSLAHSSLPEPISESKGSLLGDSGADGERRRFHTSRSADGTRKEYPRGRGRSSNCVVADRQGHRGGRGASGCGPSRQAFDSEPDLELDLPRSGE